MGRGRGRGRGRGGTPQRANVDRLKDSQGNLPDQYSGRTRSGKIHYTKQEILQWPHRDQLQYYQDLHTAAEATDEVDSGGSGYDKEGNFKEEAGVEGGGSGGSGSYMNQSQYPNHQFLSRNIKGNFSRNQCDLPRDGQGNGLAPTPPAGVGASGVESVLSVQVAGNEEASARGVNQPQTHPSKGHFLAGTNPNILSRFTPCHK